MMGETRASAPLIEILEVTKQYGGLRPLRVRHFQVTARDRIALSGLDEGAAETLVHLITGASLPDEGTVRVGERDTRDIATDTEWLASLDRFGIVTRRAVLIGGLPIEQNLALPLTLSIDPMADDIRAAVETVADLVGLPRARLTAPAATLLPVELVRVHLARSLATAPHMLLLEHPTAGVEDQAERVALGRVLRDVGEARGIGWIALTEDEAFAQASGARPMKLRPATGDVVETQAWWRKLMTVGRSSS